ncbi:GDP-mannose 4,6-dehydratase [Lysobacter sp. Root690]|uniref:GDP-mannose 4,6-dehydratase n=1 Tax=Lysobacter sp. Root690 TaxID=1736588 RepID=UPI0006F64410|nr:GDP-mannose 4,6-dehydratase [Lysobacter sp. Root690]KRB11064.1 NAD-dependent dehydratase [Lysobacter sp. Root690]
MSATLARRLLVTGAGGFVGGHVEAACGDGGKLADWTFCAVPSGLDIRDAQAVAEVVAQVRPDAVLHLAAQSFVPRSFEQPQETFDINLGGTLNLLLALRDSSFAGRLVYVSSGDVYGKVPESELPVNEQRQPEPRSPYAVSKIAAEQLCMQWVRTEGLDAVIARPFNHIGPGQDARFVLPALARQIVEVERGERDTIEVGDIDTTRDFTDVRDIVAAYAAMLSGGQTGATYCVASGRERRIRDLLGVMAGLAGVNPDLHQDPSRLRPAEQRRMVGDSALLSAHTGWTPSITLETTLHDILNDVRNHS